jgi:hypothetical protein
MAAIGVPRSDCAASCLSGAAVMVHIFSKVLPTVTYCDFLEKRAKDAGRCPGPNLAGQARGSHLPKGD